MKELVLQGRKKECWFCGKKDGLHLHEIYFGSANRKISIENGFQVYLCAFHHNLGGLGKCVHECREMDLELKRACQKAYEDKGHTRGEFIGLIGKNYLE
jgi:hypothetical protein